MKPKTNKRKTNNHRTKKQCGGNAPPNLQELEFQYILNKYHITSNEILYYINVDSKLCQNNKICIDTQKYLDNHMKYDFYANDGNINYQILIAYAYVQALLQYSEFNALLSINYNDLYLIDYQNLCFYYTRYNGIKIHTENLNKIRIINSIKTLAKENPQNIYLFINPDDNNFIKFLKNNLIQIGINNRSATKYDLNKMVNNCKFTGNTLDLTDKYSNYVKYYLDNMEIYGEKQDLLEGIDNFYKGAKSIYFFYIMYISNRSLFHIPIFKNYLQYNINVNQFIREIIDPTNNIIISYIDDSTIKYGFGGNTIDDILLLFIGNLINESIRIRNIYIISNDNFDEFSGEFINNLIKVKNNYFVNNILRGVELSIINNLLLNSSKFKKSLRSQHQKTKKSSYNTQRYSRSKKSTRRPR